MAIPRKLMLKVWALLSKPSLGGLRNRRARRSTNWIPHNPKQCQVGAGSHAEEHFERTVDFINSWKQGMTDDQKIAFANQLADVCIFRFYNDSGGKNNLTDSSLKGNTSSEVRKSKG